MKRILKLNYRRVNVAELRIWLTDNKYIFEIVHGSNEVSFAGGDVVIGSLLVSLELYSDEAEVATRLKWNVEQ